MNNTSFVEKSYKGEFKHYISLGCNCYIAMGFEKLGLRDGSYPLDWLGSEQFIGGVDEILHNHFIDILDYDKLYQKKEYPYAYKNRKYMLRFPHDFNGYDSLKKQLPSVKEKYQRRIDRFYSNITESTLFFRYCATKEEVEYLNENYQEFIDFLRSFNSENDLILIVNNDIEAGIFKNIPNVFVVKKDDGEKFTKEPLLSNDELRQILENAVYDKKEDNMKFQEQKQYKKEHHEYTLSQRLKKKLIKQNIIKPYIHDKQY